MRSTFLKQPPKSQQKNFHPPYCPNPECTHHTNPKDRFWIKKGVRKIKKYPGFNCRYQCKACSKWFSFTSFALDYRRQSDHFEQIFHTSTQGMSNRSIARMLNISEHKVRDCLKVLARQALLKWESLTKDIKIEEPVAYDGFETFIYSQYDPNNINHLVGKKSLFVYDFNYAHLNRKGVMTASQKVKLKKIEKKFGRYPSNRIRVQTRKIFHRMQESGGDEITLHTDEHKSYELALEKDLKTKNIKHELTNSKMARTSSNPLFPVNHLDMKLRHFLKCCTRETIGFSKNESGLMDRVILFLVSKNFLRSKFIKGKQSSNRQSPAMIVGVLEKILSFKEFFSFRMTSVQVKLRKEWEEFYFRRIECCRYGVAQYFGV